MTNFKNELRYAIMQIRFHYRETPWVGKEEIQAIKDLIEATDILDYDLYQQIKDFCTTLPAKLIVVQDTMLNVLAVYEHSIYGVDLNSLAISDIDSATKSCAFFLPNCRKGKIVAIGYNADTHLHVIRLQQQNSNLFPKTIVPDSTIYIYDKLHKLSACIPLQYKVKPNHSFLSPRNIITQHHFLSINTRNKLIQFMESKTYPKVLSIVEPDEFCPYGEIILQISKNKLETIDLQGNTLFLGESSNFYHDEKVTFSLKKEAQTEEKYIPIRVWHKPWQYLLNEDKEELQSTAVAQSRVNIQDLHISTEKHKQKIIIALHGLFDHKGAYNELAKTLLADSETTEQLLVIAADWPTYGASLDRQENMPTFSVMKQYLMALLKHVAITYPKSECYLLGESLGATMIFICSSEIKALQLQHPCISGVCAISPAIHNPTTNLYLQQRFLGYSAEPSVFHSIWFNDPEVNHQNALSRVRATIPYLSEAYLSAQHWPKEIPCTVFVTSHDCVVLKSDILSFYQLLKSNNVVFYAFPSRHLLLRSLSENGKYIDRNIIFHDIGKIFSIMGQGKFSSDYALPFSHADSTSSMQWYHDSSEVAWCATCYDGLYKGYLTDWISTPMFNERGHLITTSLTRKEVDSKSFTANSLLGILHDGIQALEFIEHPVIGDGDCGFHALGITRQQLVSVLLPLETDNNIRRTLASEIRYTLLSDDIVDNIKPRKWLNIKDNYQTSWDTLENKMSELKVNIEDPYPSELELNERVIWLKEKIDDAVEQEELVATFTAFNKNNQYVNEFCELPEAFVSYISLYLIPKTLWLGYQTALLWAQASQTSLTIWRHTTNTDNTLSLVHYYNAPEERNIIHLLHTSGFTHFNLLEQIKIRNLATERAQILEWNANLADWSLDYTLYELFITQTKKTPAALATISSSKSLTYIETLTYANQIAQLLKNRDIKPNQLVAVLMHKGWEQTVACLGILGSGAAFLPIDADWPELRIQQILAQGKVAIVLTQEAVLISLAGSNILSGIETFAVDDYSVWKDFSINNLSRQQQPRDIAYVIFTSGSTGKPKGVIINHQNAINTIFDINERFNINDHDKILALSNLSFDLAIYDFFGIWCSGGAVILPDGDKLKDPSHWLHLLIAHKVTIWNTVPMFMQMMVEHLNYLPKDSYSSIANTLRLTLLSGDWIPLELPNRIKQYFPINRVISLGGATEGSIWSIIYPIKETDTNWKSIPYGKPMRNQKMYVLNDDLLHCPLGIVGEIHIGGQGVALGYWGDVERSAISFIEHPVTGERLYKTGDLGKWSKNGYIEFIGRKDTQVKISGHRIELGEIESVLMHHSSVKQCVVLSYKQEKQQNLVAYIVPKTQKILTLEIAKDHDKSWQKVYENIYADNNIDDLDLNIVGWHSSYTDKPIPKIEMEEWVKHTTNCILSLKPKKVLEIGCGTGLLVARIAPHCEEYIATDISANAINLVQILIRSKKLDHVKTIQRSADDFSGWEDLKVDTIIINSVIQCFSNAEYLLNIINHASKLLFPSGKLFVGDVRHLGLLEAYHASVQFHKTFSSIPKDEFLRKVQMHVVREEELLVDPTFFHALKHHIPNLQHTQIILKTGKYFNELNKFRYDVILFISEEPIILVKPILKNWLASDNLATLCTKLYNWKTSIEEGSLQVMGIKSIPNARLSVEEKTLKWMNADDKTALTDELRAGDITGIDPHDIIQIGNTLNLYVELRWHYKNPIQLFDAFFVTQSPSLLSFYPAITCEEPCCDTDDWQEYVNNPILIKLQRELVPELNNYLVTKLPYYMIPSTFILMSLIPLSSNGKVDRKALPFPDSKIYGNFKNTHEEITHTETILLELFSKALGQNIVGTTDSFFELGGNSLLAVQLIAAINQSFKANHPISLLFTHKTVKELARVVQSYQDEIGYKPLLSFNIEGKYIPIFFVHSGRGGAEAYVELARYFDLKQPIHVIESYNLYNEPPFLNSIETMARHYLQIVKGVQPRGPYYLGGWSQGGIVAYEMAQMLKKQEERTNAIYFLDTFLYSKFECDQFRSGADNFLRNDPFYKNLPQPYQDHAKAADRAQTFAMLDYKPQPYDGDVVLLKARDRWIFLDTPEFKWNWFVRQFMHHAFSKKHNGWSKLVPNLNVHIVPGHHQSIMEGDNARTMARIIQDDALIRQATPSLGTEKQEEAIVDSKKNTLTSSDNDIVVRCITSVVYDNPMLNYGLLGSAIKYGGISSIDRLIAIGKDKEAATCIVEAVDEYGADHVFNIIFSNERTDVIKESPKITDQEQQEPEFVNDNEYNFYHSNKVTVGSYAIKEIIESFPMIKYFFKEIIHIPLPLPEFIYNNYFRISIYYVVCNVGVFSITGKANFILSAVETAIYGSKILAYESLTKQKYLDVQDNVDQSINTPIEFVEKCGFDIVVQSTLGLISSKITSTSAIYNIAIGSTVAGTQCYNLYSQGNYKVQELSLLKSIIPYTVDGIVFYIATQNMVFDLSNPVSQMLAIKQGFAVMGAIVTADYISKLFISNIPEGYLENYENIVGNIYSYFGNE